MLKEVGASGQISLGKKYAGRLFEVIVHPDDRFELVPMKAVPVNQAQEDAASYGTGDGWLTPERLAARRAASLRTPEEMDAARNHWEIENKDAIEAMNSRMAKMGSMARRIHEWRKAKASA